jgi:hypothetical protein
MSLRLPASAPAAGRNNRHALAPDRVRSRARPGDRSADDRSPAGNIPAPKSLWRVVVVDIAVAVALPFISLVGALRITIGGMGEPVDLATRHRLLEGGVDGVRFGRQRQIDDHLRQRQLALGRAQHLVGVAPATASTSACGIGQPDILRPPCGSAGAPGTAGPRRHRACARNSRAPRRGRSRDGLVQRRDQVVVPVLRLVVDRRAALHHGEQALGVEHFALRRATATTSSTSPSSARPSPSASPRSVSRASVQTGSACPASPRPADQPFPDPSRPSDSNRSTWLRLSKRGVELEGRVLGRRPHQHHGAVFHHGQETVLLGPVEAMDLVDEQQRAMPGERSKRAFSNTFLRSATPEKIADICSKP